MYWKTWLRLFVPDSGGVVEQSTADMVALHAVSNDALQNVTIGVDGQGIDTHVVLIEPIE